MTINMKLKGRFGVRSVKAGKEGNGDFVVLSETEGKYPTSINVALPLDHHFIEGEVLDFDMEGEYKTFQRDGRVFVTLFVKDYRAERYEVELKKIGSVGTKVGSDNASGAASVASAAAKPKS